jgi:hypothetical protein
VGIPIGNISASDADQIDRDKLKYSIGKYTLVYYTEIGIVTGKFTFVSLCRSMTHGVVNVVMRKRANTASSCGFVCMSSYA